MSTPLLVRWYDRRSRPDGTGITLDGDGGRQVRVRYADRTRVKGTFETPFGTGRELETVGQNRKRLEVRGHPYWSREIPATKAGVDSLIRRIRPEDQAAIAALDVTAEHLRKQLTDLKRDRRDMLHEAWQRGNKVSLKEIVEMAETR